MAKGKRESRNLEKGKDSCFLVVITGFSLQEGFFQASEIITKASFEKPNGKQCFYGQEKAKAL